MVATLDDILKQQARGKYVMRMGVSATTLAVSAAGASAGFISLSFTGNSIGSTLPSTIADFLMPAGITGDLWTVASVDGFNTNLRGWMFARIYKVGTVVLTATGNQFTHDAATFPLLRTEFGVASKPQALWAVIQVTTALSTTAAAFTMNYVNEDGTSVTGTRTFTFPAATTGQGSVYFLPLEQGDWACRDVSAINVTTASATGAATVWLMEQLEPTYNAFAGPLTADYISGHGLAVTNQTPAVATSGTATTNAVFSLFGASAAAAGAATNISVLS